MLISSPTKSTEITDVKLVLDPRCFRLRASDRHAVSALVKPMITLLPTPAAFLLRQLAPFRFGPSRHAAFSRAVISTPAATWTRTMPPARLAIAEPLVIVGACSLPIRLTLVPEPAGAHTLLTRLITIQVFDGARTSAHH